MGASVRSIISHGPDGLPVDIECQLSNSLPNIVIVGFATKTVDESKERIRGAFANAGLQLPRKRISINLAPADVPKDSSSLDMPIAVAILAAAQGSSCLDRSETPLSCHDPSKAPATGLAAPARAPGSADGGSHTRKAGRPSSGDTDATSAFGRHDQAFIGELGLDGTIRPVRGIIGKLLCGRRHGIRRFFIPAGNIRQAAVVPGIDLLPVSNLRQLARHFSGQETLPAVHSGDGRTTAATTGTVRGGQDGQENHGHALRADSRHQQPASTVRGHSGARLAAGSADGHGAGTAVSASPAVSLADIVGQAQAKRALEIAAAGGHNLLLSGPPGTGKSMLAKALPGLLPPLSHEEMLEVTHLHSLASYDFDRLVSERPFRAPHHSASHVAVVGGGSLVRPGEVSLAHRGVLFFDELPEFARDTIEALRQPLEDRAITVSRARLSSQYPANFIFVATANPCPCGYHGSTRLCECSPQAVATYRRRLSGPLLDRIDLHVIVEHVEHGRLLDDVADFADRADSHDEPDKAGSLQTNSLTHDTASIKRRITEARAAQSARFDGSARLNSDMTNRDLRQHARLSAEAKAILDLAGSRLELSARAYMRTLKVARTIADLAGSGGIETPHITEALRYRGDPSA